MKPNKYSMIVYHNLKNPAATFSLRKRRLVYRLSFLLVLSVTGISIFNVNAATVTITSNVNWSAITTGSGTGGVPSVSDDVLIQNGNTLTVNVNNAVCASIVVGGGSNNTTSILKFNNASQLTISGATTIGSTVNRKGSIDMTSGGVLKTGGTFTSPNLVTFTAGSGTVEYNSAAAQAILTSISYNNLVMNSSAKSASGAITINGNLTVNNTASFSTTAAVNINGNLTADGSYTQTSAATTFTGNGTHTLSGTGIIQVKDLVTTNQTIDAGSSNIRISGNWTHTTSGKFNHQTSSVMFNGSGAQTIPSNTFVPEFYNLTINNGGSITSLIWKVNNNFELQSSTFSPLANSSFRNVILTGGTFNCPAGSINIKGNLTNNSSFTSNSGTVVMNGNSLQNIAGNTETTFNNLTMNNSSGLILNGSVNMTVNGTLNLTTGVISTNANKVILGTNGNVIRTSGHINGNLQKKIQGGNGITMIFEIGSSIESDYTPVNLTFTNLNNTGNLVVSTTNGDHSLTGSSFNPNITINRYWTITNPVPGGINFDNCSITFHYNTSNADPGVNSSTIYAGKYVSNNWYYPVLGVRADNQMTITGETTFGNYQLGDCEKPVINVQSLTNVSCYGGSDGSASVFTSGGTLPVSFSWTPGESNTTIINGLMAGEYTIAAITYGGCTEYKTISISEPTIPVVSISGGGNVCISNTTSDIQVHFTGGTAPWTFVYNDGSDHTITTSDNPYVFSVTPLATTTYTLNSLTDANNCSGVINSASTQISVTSLSDGGVIAAENSVCFGTGSTMQLNNTNGDVIMWQSSTDNFISPPLDIANNTNTLLFDNLTQKTYFRAVVKNNGCAQAYSAVAAIDINLPTAGSATISECSNSLPFIWHDADYFTSGIYQTNLTNAAGCDSTAYLDLTIKHSTSSVTTISECDMFGWNGIDYVTSGRYTDHFTNAEGCDSTATLELIIKRSLNSTSTISECENYLWNGVNYTTSGTYNKHFINSEGCDSTAELKLTINHNTSSITNVSECESYSWNGETYTASGMYEKHFVNSNGCDSTATLNLIIKSSTSSATSVTECDSYMWNGISYATTGIYNMHFTNAEGCDSIATLNLNIRNSSNSITTITECESYSWNGNTYSTSGEYISHFTNSQGCDSTANLNLVITQSSSSSVSVTECDSYNWNGNTYTSSGNYSKHFINAAGCDSVATLVLTINNSITSIVSVTECDSYIWNSDTYSSSGIYNRHFSSISGCDSLVILNLLIHQSTYSNSVVTVCNNYNWGGTNYSSSGIYYQQLTNAEGCDSTAMLNLFITNSSSSITTITECDNYMWNGQMYNSSGVYNKYYTNADECDSTATLILTINNSTSSDTNITECHSYTWNENTYTSSGVFEEQFTNSAGCDSIAYLNLTINPTHATSFSAVTCDNYLLPWNVVVTATGSYNHTYTNIYGCDSIVTANIVVNNTPQAPAVTVVSNCSATICTATNFSGSLLWNNGSSNSSISVNTPGTYTVYQTVNGCTSQPANAIVPDVPYGAPVLQTNPAGPGGACRRQNNIVFSVVPAPGATSYLWTLPVGVTGTSSGPSITLNFTNQFNGGTVCVKATNACGVSASKCKTLLRLTQAPSAPTSIVGPSSLCPLSINTYSVAALASATGYLWTTTGDLTILTGQGTNTVTVKALAGFVSGSLKVKAENCQGTSAKTTKNINGVPSKPIWKVNPPISGCPGSCYNFNIDNVQDAASWTFTAPAGCIISSPNNGSGNPLTTRVSFATICFPAGFVSGTVTIVSNNTCGSSKPLTYTIYSKPPAPADISGPVNGVCNATGVIYSIQPVPGATSYSWTVPANAVITQYNGTSIKVDFASNFNSGNICVKARNSCGSGSKTCITVASTPAMPVIVIGSSTVCRNQSRVTYSVNPVAGATSYSWSVTGNATIVSGTGTTSVKVKFTSVNSPACTLSVKAKNACGSSASTKFTVTVNHNCRTEQEENIQTALENNINVYPNPAGNYVRISFEAPKNESYTLNIVDMIGNVFRNEIIEAQEGINVRELNLEGAAKGMYLIVLQDSGMKRKTLRLVIE